MYALIVLVVALIAGKSHKALNSDLQFLLLAIIAVIIVDALLLRRSIGRLAKERLPANPPAALRSTRSCAPCSCGASATRRRGSSPAIRSRPLRPPPRPGPGFSRIASALLVEGHRAVLLAGVVKSVT